MIVVIKDLGWQRFILSRFGSSGTGKEDYGQYRPVFSCFDINAVFTNLK
jgi:hypothetical protein